MSSKVLGMIAEVDSDLCYLSAGLLSLVLSELSHVAAVAGPGFALLGHHCVRKVHARRMAAREASQ